MRTFFSRLSHHAAVRPNHAAIATDTQILSYADLLHQVESGRNFLLNCGIASESTVGLSIANEIEHLLATLSVMATGAGQIVLATHDTMTLRTHLAKRTNMTHVLSTDAMFKIDHTEFIHWPNQKIVADAVPSMLPPESGATIYLRTSGTTGDLNIVAIGNDQFAAQAEQHPYYADERGLRLASIEHNNSKRHRLYSVWVGGTSVFLPEEKTDIGKFSLRHGVTSIDISRIHASDLIRSDSAYMLAGVKLRASGSEMPLEIRQLLQHKVTHNLYVRYGATECGSISMALPGDHDADETSGRPKNGVELQIVDSSNCNMPPGHPGEIRLRAPGMATGYFDSPEDSAKRFQNGWFYPGDIGYLRTDGQLIVQGRKDDMIILNGINIFPAEIERVLDNHPAVNESAALPLSSRIHGQIPVAAVELKSGFAITALELQTFCRQHLALRAPRRILIIDSLPRNSQHKILKRELSKAFEIKKGNV